MATRKHLRAPGATETGRVLIMFEQMQTQMQALNEAIFSTRDDLKRSMNERMDKLELRIEALEMAVRKNSEDIRKNSEDIRKNSDDIEKLRIQLESLTQVVATKIDERALAALEARVANIEHRLGI